MHYNESEVDDPKVTDTGVVVEAPKYIAMLQQVANLQRTQVTIDLDDMIAVRDLFSTTHLTV